MSPAASLATLALVVLFSFGLAAVLSCLGAWLDERHGPTFEDDEE